MRIVHVSDCYLPRIGGIERQVHDLAIRQLARGDEVHVVTSTIGPSSPGGLEPLRVVRPSSRRVDPATMRYRWSLRGSSAVVALEPDVVHVHCSTWSPLGFASAAAAVRAGVPTVVTLHSMWARAAVGFRLSDVLLRWRRLPIAWSAVSSVAAEPLRRVVGSIAPVDVLPNGAEFPPPSTADDARDPSRVVLVTVGRLSTRKRPEHLLRLLRRVRDLVPADIEMELLLVGDGPLRRSLQRFVARAGMDAWVHLVGAVDHDEIGAFYRRADIYVAPATLESFGIAALEACAAGLPVVAYASTGIADFIRHDVDGLLAGSDDDMVNEIARLVGSVSTRARIRAHNKSQPAPITWACVMERTDALYAQARSLVGQVEGVGPLRASAR